MQHACLEHPCDTHEPPEYEVGDTVLCAGEDNFLYALEVKEKKDRVIGRVTEIQPFRNNGSDSPAFSVEESVSVSQDAVLGVRDG